MNPELRHTLNTISRNFESANETAQENIYSFSQHYIDPCLGSLKSCILSCYPNREDQLRRKRGRSRGRAELNFDFYDDWDDEEDTGEGLMGWGNDELDRLLAGTSSRGARQDQPQKQRVMSYGTRGRRKNSIIANDSGQDPTVIPSSAYLGFLERLPWKLGGRGLRYKPSAADLQENPGGLRQAEPEGAPLLEASDEDEEELPKSKHSRKRSSTVASRSTTNSLSSRGDLILSDEDDDAVPLGDEFAMVLERRVTNQEDRGSGRTGSDRGPTASRTSTRTASSKSAISSAPPPTSTGKGSQPSEAVIMDVAEPLSASELEREEELVRREEEDEVDRKREAAQRLALSRGLSNDSAASEETKSEIQSNFEEIPKPNPDVEELKPPDNVVQEQPTQSGMPDPASVLPAADRSSFPKPPQAEDQT